MRRAKSDEFQDLLDDGAPKRLFDLPVRVVVTIDGATLTQERDRVPVVRAREQPDVIDLRNPTREQLDGARCYVSIIVLADRGVVRAVQLMDIDADGMSVRKDPIDAAALFVDLRRQGSHLSGLEDAIEIGPHWIPSWQSSHRELTFRRSRQMRPEGFGRSRAERREEQGRQHEVVGPIPVRRKPLVGRVAVVNLGQHDEPDRPATAVTQSRKS